MDAYFTKIPVGDPVEDTCCSGLTGSVTTYEPLLVPKRLISEKHVPNAITRTTSFLRIIAFVFSTIVFQRVF